VKTNLINGGHDPFATGYSNFTVSKKSSEKGPHLLAASNEQKVEYKNLTNVINSPPADATLEVNDDIPVNKMFTGQKISREKADRKAKNASPVPIKRVEIKSSSKMLEREDAK
jgi:hypothetical protein